MPIFKVTTDGGTFNVTTDGGQEDSQSSYSSSYLNGTPNTNTSDGLKGVPAFGVEVGRGLEKGTGQMIADTGFLANAGGLLKNPIGTSVQQFGNELISKANEIPETDLGGFTKGLANFTGEATPMLATLAGGEALGMSKLGEGGIKLLSAASKSNRVAGILSNLIRPVGQATLFGITNAIDTASTLPETMDFNQRVNEIYNSGKTGFITGALLTPVMDKFTDVLSKFGESAGKAFMIGMTGSPKAAEEALDLTRKQGSYNQLEVNPLKPHDDRISFKTTMANELSPTQRDAIHQQILDQQDAEIKGVRDSHAQSQLDLQDKINQSKHDFSMAEKQVTSQIDEAYKLQKQARESVIEGNIAKVASDNTQKLDALEMANVQRLNNSSTLFDKHVQNTIDLMDANKSMLYGSVIKTDPTGGFQVDGIISKIKSYLKQTHNIDLLKSSKPASYKGGQILASDLPPELSQAMSTRPPFWTAKANNTSGIISPDASKAVKFLTGEKGYLAELEKLKETNGGKISLEMLKNDSKLIKQMSYNPETGVSDSGLAQLDATIRPNRLVGDIANSNDAGLWKGSSTSLSSLKEAALHDAAIADLLDTYKSIKGEIMGNKDFTTNLTPKVKALLNNQEGYNSIRRFEDSLNLDSKSPLRLTNTFQDYAKTSDEIATSRQKLKSALSTAIDNQKFNLERELGQIKRGEISDVLNKRFADKEAMIELKRKAMEAKSQDLEKAQLFKHQLIEKISLENKAREQAANEIATIGSYGTAMGKIQRGAMFQTTFGALYGSPHAGIAAGLTAALTPRTSIGMARSVKSFLQSGQGKMLSGSLRTATKSKVAQRLLIGSLLRSQRNRTNPM